MLVGDEESFKLRIFVDRTLVEMFASGRDVFTSSGVTEHPEHLGMRLFAVGGSVKVKSLDIYEINSIWKR